MFISVYILCIMYTMRFFCCWIISPNKRNGQVLETRNNKKKKKKKKRRNIFKEDNRLRLNGSVIYRVHNEVLIITFFVNRNVNRSML